MVISFVTGVKPSPFTSTTCFPAGRSLQKCPLSVSKDSTLELTVTVSLLPSTTRSPASRREKPPEMSPFCLKRFHTRVDCDGKLAPLHHQVASIPQLPMETLESRGERCQSCSPVRVPQRT